MTQPTLPFNDGLGDYWRDVKHARQQDGQENRVAADKMYPEAAKFAEQHGFQLIRHTDAHYKIKTRLWTFEVYPGNKRIWCADRGAPILITRVPFDWTLLDLVKAVQEELTSHPESVTVALPERVKPSGEFRNASVMASAHKLRFSKTGNVYRLRGKGWTIELRPDLQQVTNVDGNGPQLTLPKSWTLMNVVSAAIKAQEART